MKTITVNASKNYDIIIGENILDEAGSFIRKTAGGKSALIVADDNVAKLYGKRLSDSLTQSGYHVSQYVFPHGENSKNAETFLAVLNCLAKEKFSRKDVAVALGGGVTGDLAGFAASCYMRGINFAQIPTTLLATVDSSVGGKTAINLAAGKNLAGAFYQPNLVLCDVSLLSTLPAEIFSDGCAEIIKYGVIADRKLFDSLENPINAQLTDVISRCIEIKRDIVEEDEFENGSRKLLNFGHTVGHAIELLSGYSISHGRAVAAGMAIITRAAVKTGMCEIQCLHEIAKMLHRYNLPENTQFEAAELANACLADKKRDGKNIAMVFPEKIGKCVLKEIPVDEAESVIRLGMEEF